MSSPGAGGAGEPPPLLPPLSGMPDRFDILTPLVLDEGDAVGVREPFRCT
jgi:hypothetical protein